MIYCKRCLFALPKDVRDFLAATARRDGTPETLSYAVPKQVRRCPRCFKKYDPGDPRSYFQTLALTKWQIAIKVGLTTLVGIVVAMVVATFQMAQASGH